MKGVLSEETPSDMSENLEIDRDRLEGTPSVTNNLETKRNLSEELLTLYSDTQATVKNLEIKRNRSDNTHSV